MWTVLGEFLLFHLWNLEEWTAGLFDASPFYCSFAVCEETTSTCYCKAFAPIPIYHRILYLDLGTQVNLFL